MKRKLFFMTLLMLFCSVMFGQSTNNWVMDDSPFDENMGLTCQIKINDEFYLDENVTVGAFIEDDLRGVAKPTKDGDRYVVYMTIHGESSDGNSQAITFRLRHPDYEYDMTTTYSLSYVTGKTEGSYNNPIVIDFYPNNWNDLDVKNSCESTMVAFYEISIDGEKQERSNIELAVFCGDELRGWARPSKSDFHNDKYVAAIYIYGNELDDGDEMLSFKLYDSKADKVLETSYQLRFVANEFIGMESPETIDFRNEAVAQIGDTYYKTLADAFAAVQNNQTITLITDVELSSAISFTKDITFTIDGNGKTIKPAEDSTEANSAFNLGQGNDGTVATRIYTIKNIVFDGWTTDHVVRLQGVNATVEGCTFQNCNQAGGLGLLTLTFCEANVKGCEFKNNKCVKAIDINSWGDGSEKNATIEECVFDNNECNTTAVIYRNTGTQLVVKDSKFLNNTVTTSGNAAVLYAGWATDDEITGCYFYGNTVTTSHATTKRFASAIFCDGCTVTGNAFENNTATRNGGTITTTVAVGAYNGAANISGNYWGGNAPFPGVDYTVEFTNNNVAVNDYYKEYSEGKLSDKVTLNNVAKAGKYYYESLKDAFAAVQDGETVTMLDNVSLSESIKVNNNITLDLNGKTITGTDNNTSGNFYLFDNISELTVKGEGTITLRATTDRDWNSSSVVIANNPGGKLTIENGTIEHLGGTDMAYAIDNLTNGKATYAETVINGGTMKSPYRAIRQFLNGIEAQNILTVNGGTIEGTNKSIWMQDPSKNANTGTLTVGVNASLKGDVYLSVTEGSTEWPVEVSIAAEALKDNSTVSTNDNVPAGYELKVTNGVWGVEYGVAKIGETLYETLQAAVNAAGQNETTIVMIADAEVSEIVKVVAGQKITLDLNGKTIDGTEKVKIALMSYGDLTIKDSTTEKNGTIKAGIGTAGNTINVCAGTFTFESGNIYSKNNAILIDKEAATININGGNITAEPQTRNSAAFYISSTSETTLNITAGTMKGYNGILLWNNTEINITGGSIEATGSVAIQGNGTCDNTLINIGGEETSVKGYYAAIYHPQNGELNITNGTLEGWTGVVVKSGKVTISGGTINGIGTANEYRPAPSGFVDTGDALYVEHYDNSTNSENYGTPVVTVTGGTFNSTNAQAVASYANPNNAANGVEALANFISGGIYNTPIPEAYCAEGYIPTDLGNGKYGVKQGTFVARVNGVGYETVTAAIAAAQAGETVQLLPGEISEYIAPWANDTQHTTEKSITIIGAENFGTTLTGGLYLGYDDSQCRDHSIIVKGVAFKTKGILVACQKNVTIEGNKFENITDNVASPGSANANAISVIGKNINATVTGNVIDGTASAGINLRDTKTVNVSGNTVTNTVHNSITVQNNTTAEGDIVAIKDNTLSNWGTGGEGRAVRIAGGAEANVNGNVMSCATAPEEYVKVTGSTTLDASANYWNGNSPLSRNYFLSDLAADPVSILKSYYTDAAKSNLVQLSASVAKIGTTYYQTIADAITAARPGETVTILAGDHTADITINKAITVVGETDEQRNNLVNITGRVSAYTGATVKNLNVNNTKTGDYDCALNVNGKDIEVDGVKLTGHNAMRYCYASGNITIKNSTINGSNFAVHFDGSEGGIIVFENTDITGWASYASTVNNVSYTNCDFDRGNYSGHRYYNKNISFNECTFNAGLLIDLKASGSNVAFTDADMTVADVKALFTNPYYVANGNVTLNGNPVLYAASANSKYYNTLQECIDDLPADGTNWYVTLRSDNVLTAPITIPADKKMIFALNGFDITYTSDVQGDAMITNNGVLTIEGGNEDKVAYKFTGAPDTNYGKGNYTIYNNGTLTVESGIVENTTDAMSHASYAINTGAGATLNIKGGKVLNLNGHAVRMVSFGTNVNNVYITGGYIEGTRALQVQLPGSATSTTKPEMNLSISGGELKSNEETYNLAIYVYSNGQSAENLNVALAGGTFNGNVAINEVATKTMKEDAVKVTNGTFNGAYGVFSYAEDAVAVPVISITGGTFASNYAEKYALDDGFKFVFDNTTQMYGLQEFSDLEISNLNELIAFRNAVNAGNSFAGQTVVLKSGINLNPTRAAENWIPIGTSANPFKGTFDGGNVTISNLVVEGENNVGLFGYADNATIKNVKLENVNVKGTNCVGAIAGQVFSTSLIDNCHVSGSIQVEGQTNVGGIVGKYYTKVKNCSVIGDGVTTSHVKGTYKASDFEGDNIAGIMGHGGENNTFENNTVKNITISGTRKVAGIVGVTDQNTDVVNCLVENVNIVTTATAEYAEANKTKAGHAPIVGSYTIADANKTYDGTVIGCTVKNVTFVNDNNVTASFGPITGGAREGMIAPSAGVTASNNNIYMSTITGTATTGTTTNMYLMNVVAKIGETKYYTLQEAVDAGNGETINVIGNTTEVINIADNAVIDLNFSEGVTLNGYFAPFKANLTINGGTINNTNSGYSAIEINAGELNLENVIISSARHAVRIDGAVEATINGGEYTLTATSGTRHAVNVSGGAEVTITAGTFEGPKGTTMDSGSAVCVQSGAKVTIEGGDFSKGKNHTLSADGTLIVKGGTFDQDPSAYLAQGYVAEKTGNVWTVKLMTTEIFYTAAGVETTQDQAVYSLMFTITDNANKEVSVKIGSMKPASNSKAVLVIPATVEFDGVNEAFKVTAIEDNAFNSCRNFVGDLTLPQYVRTIGDRAFNTCHYITNPEHPKGKLTLNEGLISIGSQAFTNSYFTDGLSIPSSVTMIEPNAFQYAKIKGALTINSDVECALAFNSSEFTKVGIAEGVHKICANAFNGMVNVTEVVLPSTLTEIGLAAFGSDNAIETIWSNAETAPTIKWQSNIESNKHPFTQTVRDNAVVFVTTNYEYYTEAEKWNEFANIYGLYPIQKTGYSLLVKVNDNVCSVEIGDKPHQNARIELELPRTIEYYGTERAVTSIAKGGFKSCPFFGTLTIPGNIKTIADNAFNTCMQFNKLVIEEGVETIGNGSFNMCSNLKYISFPSTLESIGQNAFNVVYMENGGRIVSFAANPPTAYKHIYNQGINPVNPSFPQNLRNNAILYVFEESLDKYKSATGWEFKDVRPIEAKIGETYYLTLTEAITAATSGQTITLLADVEAADGNPVTIPEGVTLDINTHDVTANIYGTVKTSGGLWTTVTVPGFNSRKMLGDGAIYNTNNATVANSASEVKMLAGSIVLNPNPETEWWTLPSQNLSIALGALFEVPANIKFTVREDTHVVVEGELTVNGVVYLQKDATVEAAAGLNILTDVEGYMVSYEDGVYSVVQAIYTQTTQLIEGWNWFSYYVETDLAELQDALGTNGVQIKNQLGKFSEYLDGWGWDGNLQTLSETQMYMINTSMPCNVILSGKLMENIEITLANEGWTWIGFPMDEEVPLSVALSGIPAKTGDVIKTQYSSAEYLEGWGWDGTLKKLVPGEGYMYYSSNESPITFVYSPNSDKSELRANITADNNHWIPNAGQYANNMTMTAMVNVEGNYEIAAFVNGEVRGSARPIYVEALDSYIYFLTIHGDEVEEMSFRLYDLDTDIEYNLSDRMNYSDNAMVGSLTEPYMFNLEMLGIGENSAESFNIYPNPTTTNAEINLNATCDKVEVFNALGVKIAEYSNVDSIDAVETAGIYVIRVTDNGNVQHCRLIVK